MRKQVCQRKCRTINEYKMKYSIRYWHNPVLGFPKFAFFFQNIYKKSKTTKNNKKSKNEKRLVTWQKKKKQAENGFKHIEKPN